MISEVRALKKKKKNILVPLSPPTPTVLTGRRLPLCHEALQAAPRRGPMAFSTYMSRPV